jgi:hypothetical protein
MPFFNRTDETPVLAAAIHALEMATNITNTEKRRVIVWITARGCL